MAAKAKRKKAKKAQPRIDAVLPPAEQLADMERGIVTHAETATKTTTYKRRDSRMVEKWMDEDPETFNEPARRVIGDCMSLWLQLRTPSLTAAYGERIPSSSDNDGYEADRARRRLNEFQDALGPYMKHYWSVWENVLRYNEPAGVAGSHFARNPAQRIQSAKVIVGMVANTLAGRMGY